MITGAHIADVAEHCGLIGTPYSELDCQAFVEEVLTRAGLKTINYRGSNHMWRELVYDRHLIVNTDIPVGALVFMVRFDGGEKKRGYHDSMGNATHVGIYLGNGQVIHSTTGGVQYGKLVRFTDYGLIKDVDYSNNGGGNNEESNAGQGPTDKLQDLKRNIMSYINSIHSDLDALEDFIDDIFRDS